MYPLIYFFPYLAFYVFSLKIHKLTLIFLDFLIFSYLKYFVIVIQSITSSSFF